MIRQTVVLFALVFLTIAPGVAAQEAGREDRSDPPNLRPRRLYFGAPPAAPHETGGFMSACLSCHSPDSFAPETPHPTQTTCRQCHISGAAQPAPFRSNRFVALTRPPRAPRVQPTGPPAMAHSAVLHENCLVCHAPGARQEIISTPHPERSRCQQCHLPQRARVPEFPRRP